MYVNTQVASNQKMEERRLEEDENQEWKPSISARREVIDVEEAKSQPWYRRENSILDGGIVVSYIHWEEEEILDGGMVVSYIHWEEEELLDGGIVASYIHWEEEELLDRDDPPELDE